MKYQGNSKNLINHGSRGKREKKLTRPLYKKLESPDGFAKDRLEIDLGTIGVAGIEPSKPNLTIRPHIGQFEFEAVIPSPGSPELKPPNSNPTEPNDGALLHEIHHFVSLKSGQQNITDEKRGDGWSWLGIPKLSHHGLPALSQSV